MTKVATIQTSVFLSNSQILSFDTYIKPNGDPNYETVPGRGDLPSVHFSTTQGSVWIKATAILALGFGEQSFGEMQLGH